MAVWERNGQQNQWDGSERVKSICRSADQAEFALDALDGAGELLTPSLGSASQLLRNRRPVASLGAEINQSILFLGQPLADLFQQFAAGDTLAGGFDCGHGHVFGFRVGIDAAYVAAHALMVLDLFR